MITLPQPSTLESAAIAGAEAAHHLATVLQTQWQRFWQRDPAIVLSEIESDLPKTLAVFDLNTEASIAVNALLDAVNDTRFANRAPTDLPANWSFDGTAFVFTLPPQPEPEQPPAQEPETQPAIYDPAFPFTEP